MVKKVDTARVILWGQVVGAVSWLEDHEYGVFEYDPKFLKLGLDLSPIHMSIDEAQHSKRIFSFPALNKQTYLGLPGLLADALPDKFGNSIIDAWLARNGRTISSFSPVERLCYTGKRAMGAFEFEPAMVDQFDASVPVEVTQLVELAQSIISQRNVLDVSLGDSGKENTEAIMDILRVGTSAGGARPKAVIATNPEGKVMSGQSQVPPDYDYWILKFDGVTDLELGEPKGYGRIEYAYSLMANAAGIEMSHCRLLEENGRAHFMTKRFDRVNGRKLFMQSLCGIAHYDFNLAGAYSYEQAFMIMRKLRLTKADAIEQYRRMVFNVLARNQDDHTKNIAFLMDKDGKWRLSPAFDVTYAHNPAGQWTNQHQMTLNGKRGDFNREDLLAVAESISLKNAGEVINSIAAAVEKWPEFASRAGVSGKRMNEIAKYHRLNSVG